MIRDIVDKSRVKRALAYFLRMLIALLLQNTILSYIRIVNVEPFFLPGVCVAVGILEGGSFGGYFSLVFGILADMQFSENTVLFTMLFPFVGFMSGFLAEFYINRKFLSYNVLAFLAVLLTSIVQMFKATLFYGATFSNVATIAILQTFWSIPFNMLFYFCALRLNKIMGPAYGRKDR